MDKAGAYAVQDAGFRFSNLSPFFRIRGPSRLPSRMRLKENIEKVFERIDGACGKSGRKPEEIRLVAVSKKFSAADVAVARGFGITDFGENYAQEFRDKHAELENDGGDVIWHFVGGLQRNKVRYLVGKVDLIHTVDNMPLVAEIDKRASSAGVCARVLVEINCGEKSKRGLSPRLLRKFLEDASEFQSVSFEGLMTMPPWSEDPEAGRRWFSMLREIRDELAPEFPVLRELSMGMSADLEVAVEEGATILRVGSAIFGPRPA